MTAFYALTFVMSAVLICKWTLSHYDDDDNDNDDDDYNLQKCWMRLYYSLLEMGKKYVLKFARRETHTY